MKKLFLSLSMLALAALMVFAGPADGTWRISGNVSGVPQTLVLQVSGTSVTGTADGVSIFNGKLVKTAITFQLTQNGTTDTYKGLILGAQMNLFEEAHSLRLTYNHQ
jgi:hypothetical protein